MLYISHLLFDISHLLFDNILQNGQFSIVFVYKA